MSNFLNLIRPIITNDRIRLGRDYDGGYVVNEKAIKNANLISLGINDDWSFEQDYDKQTSNKIFMYDGSVNLNIFKRKYISAIWDIFSLLFFIKTVLIKNSLKDLISKYTLYKSFKLITSKENIKFYCSNVSNTRNSIRLKDIIQENIKNDEKCFLKIDIEGHEYRIIEDLLKNQDLITGMVIEFHDIDIMINLFTSIIDKLKGKFYITHIHANNNSYYSKTIDNLIVYEITFINKNLIPNTPQYFHTGIYNNADLDFRNNRELDDYLTDFKE
jgi:hypothetical protein